MITNVLSAKTYLRVLLLMLGLAILAILVINTRGFFSAPWLSHQILYQHQLKKIAGSAAPETLFIGDSSLGNSIDASYFSELSGSSTLNLSLSGLYGFAGSYNMLKKADHPGLRNVVVMQTIDMMKRPVAWDGYLLTLSGPADLLELSATELSNLISAYFDLVFSVKNLKKVLKVLLGSQPVKEIDNDYIRQRKPIDIDEQPNRLSPGINGEKPLFLNRLVEYCNRRGLNLIYVQGPVLKKMGTNSMPYIRQSMAGIASTGVEMLERVTLIENQHIGDAYDHVSPAYKPLYTSQYYRMLAPVLKY